MQVFCKIRGLSGGNLGGYTQWMSSHEAGEWGWSDICVVDYPEVLVLGSSFSSSMWERTALDHILSI